MLSHATFSCKIIFLFIFLTVIELDQQPNLISAKWPKMILNMTKQALKKSLNLQDVS